MRERYKILESLKSSFLATQASIDNIAPGSIINSLLYANSVELSLAFDEIDALKNSLYIDTATGTNLDLLIKGFSNLTRLPAKSSVGYVLVELGTILTDQNLDSLNFSFAQYDSLGNVNSSYPNVATFSINNKNGGNSQYAIVNPLNFSFSIADFIISGTTGSQVILNYYKEYLKVIYRKYKKPIKYLVLPIAAVSSGSDGNAPSGSIDVSLNLGFPCMVSNPFTFSANPRKAYAYLKDTSVSTDVILADIDGVVNGNGTTYGLENFSYVSGGIDVENDASYRSRFYSYLESLSKGTSQAIQLAVATEFPNATFSIVETPTLGSIDVYVDTNFVLSKPVLQRIKDSIDSVKPVGIYISVKPTKNLFVSVVGDIESSDFEIDVDAIRSSMYDLVDSKGLSKTLSYDEIINSTFPSNITKKDNFYYGEFLNPVLFNLYKEDFQKLYAKFGVKGTGVTTASTNPWSYITYNDVYDQIINNDSSIYMAYSGANIKYPLIGLVRKALLMTEAEKASLTSVEIDIVNSIQSVCVNSKPSQCLSQIIPNSNSYSESEESPLISSITIPSGKKITLENLTNIVGKNYSNYFKIKLLTIPFIKKERSDLAIPLLKRLMSTDVIYFTYDDLLEAPLEALEKLKIMRDFNLSSGIYTDASVFGARPLER